MSTDRRRPLLVRVLLGFIAATAKALQGRLTSNGRLLRKLEEPQTVDNVPWMKVRTSFNGQEYEGWVSMNFIEQV